MTSNLKENNEMKQQQKRVVVEVAVRGMDRGGGDMPGFLDMLRYDGATVVNWTYSERGYLVTLVSDRGFTFDRWNSFGLYPKEVL